MKYVGWQKFLAVALAVSALSACSGTPEPDFAELQSFDQQVSPQVAWRARVGGGTGEYFSRLRPVHHDGVVYAADRQGEVVALDVENGNRLWRSDVSPDGSWSIFGLFRPAPSARISGGLVYNDGSLYFGTENGDMYALDAATGEVRWHSKLRGEALSAPAVDEGYVVAHLGDGSVVALSAETGEQRWVHDDEVPPLSLRGASSPVIAAGGVIVGTNSGRSVVLILESGQMAWDERVFTPTGSSDLDRMVDIDAAPVVRGDVIYLLGYNSELVALQLRTGETMWRRDYSGYRTPQLTAARIFVTSSESHVISLDRINGNERWRNSNLYGRSLTEGTVSSQYLVTADRFGYVHWLDRESGQIVGRFETGDDPIHVAPVEAGDYLIVQTASGRILALQH